MNLHEAFKLQQDKHEKDSCGSYLLFFYYEPKKTIYRFVRVKLKLADGRRIIRPFEPYIEQYFEYSDKHIEGSLIPRFNKIAPNTCDEFWYPVLADEVDLLSAGIQQEFLVQVGR